jgi:hypothetical protein
MSNFFVNVGQQCFWQKNDAPFNDNNNMIIMIFIFDNNVLVVGRQMGASTKIETKNHVG